MRTSRVLSLIAGAALLAACGDDNGNGPQNQAPTAGFTFTCDLLECTFTSTSTDPDGTIASVSWDFGDGESGTTTPVTHTYAAAGDYDVVLTVTDNEGGTDDFTQTVTVEDTPNINPTGNFTFACTDLNCQFTDASSDQDGTLAAWSWDFDDGTAAVTQRNPAHAFAAAGTYDVTLTVTDNRGGTGTVTKAVAVTAPSGGDLQADFDVSCSANVCTFTNTTVGATGAVVTWNWDFGDGQTSTEQNPTPVTYTVSEPTTFTITLVVDSDGAVSQASQQVTVSPAAGLTCDGAACTLTLDEAATVVVTLVSSDCEAHGNTFVITQPAEEVLFEDGCFATPGTSFPLNSGAAYAAGTELAAEVRTGVAGAVNPQLQVTGSFDEGWTLKFDDGFVGAGEPDFDDLVISVVATPATP